MAPLRREHSTFRFTSSVPLKLDGVTELHFKVPSAPWRMRGARPTIARIFKKNPSTSAQKGVLQQEAEADSDSDDEGAGASVRTLPAMSMDVDRSPSPAPSSASGVHTKIETINFHNPPAAGSRKGKEREFVMYPTTPSNTQAHGRASPAPAIRASPAPASSASTARLTRRASRASISQESRSSSVPPPDATATLWTRWGVKDGEPFFRRRTKGTSTSDKDCVTAWWESFSHAPLRTPPDLSSRPDLAIDDVYCNRVPGQELPQLWVWAASGHQSPRWKPVAEGDAREDGRRLYCTPKNKDPSWVESNWCFKQLLKRQRTVSRI